MPELYVILKMKPNRIIITLIFSLIVLGCKKDIAFKKPTPALDQFQGYKEFLSKAEKITLFSTKSESPEYATETSSTSQFHRYEILGTVEFADAASIKSIVSDLENNISRSSSETYTYCFNPRHGLRVHVGDSVKDFQLCYECHHLYIFDDITHNPGEGEYIRIELDENANNDLLNGLLDKHNIKRETPIKRDNKSQ